MDLEQYKILEGSPSLEAMYNEAMSNLDISIALEAAGKGGEGSGKLKELASKIKSQFDKLANAAKHKNPEAAAAAKNEIAASVSEGKKVED